MSEEYNNNEEEPVRFTDKRRIDPETGQLRDQPEDHQATEPEQETSEHADPLAQVEDILNAAGSESDESPVEEEVTAEQAAIEEANQLRDDLQRLQAEFVNYRRRVERDREVAKDNANFAVLESMLPVLDDLDAAEAAGDLEGPFAAIARKLVTTLEGIGLVRQDADSVVGQPFDPAQHEAMLRQPSSEVAEEHVIQVLRNGYLYNERVLRAAQVMVSAGDE